MSKQSRTRSAAVVGGAAVAVAALIMKGLPFLVGYGLVSGLSGSFSDSDLADMELGVADVGADWRSVQALWADSTVAAAQKMVAVIVIMHLEDAELRDLLRQRAVFYDALMAQSELWPICEGGATTEGGLDDAADLFPDLAMRYTGRASGRMTLGLPPRGTREPSEAEFEAIKAAMDDTGYSEALDQLIGRGAVSADACTFRSDIYEFASGAGADELGLSAAMDFVRWLEMLGRADG